MNRDILITFARKHRTLSAFLCALHNYFPFVNRWAQSPETHLGLSFLKSCRFSGGRGNTLIVGDFARLKHCRFHFEGTGNTVRIESRCMCDHGEFWVEGSGNTISLGEHTALCGQIQLAALEGTDIHIGADCLFADNIRIRTGDSHSLLKKGTRQRLNPAKSVSIGNHVWVGTGVTILKGASVADNCMVGAGSLITAQHKTGNCVLAGVPARELKQDIDWTSELVQP